MIPVGCEYETELFEALTKGRWPDACSRELRDHVAECRDCGELASVAGALIEDRRSGEHAVTAPPAGAVWWRMQLRLERENKETAARTVKRAHGAVVAATLVTILAVLAMTSLIHTALGWLNEVVPHFGELVSVAEALPLTGILLIALVVIVFAPVAVYLAVAND